MTLTRHIKSFALVIFFLVLHSTSTFSRHHGIRHGRHKRNHGAHLYLTESSIIPGGEGSPSDRWGEWGAPSECSRSCGGGVAYQTRECHNVDADDRPKCRGGDKKYFSCNTQDCPDDDQDFRQQQCSHFDHQPFEGQRYEWVPYTKAPNPCELNCMPRGERFYYRHKLKVIDGTRCNDETLDVCVDGACQPVGCDMMLGSNATEDKCRKCSGDGTTCQTESGLLDTNYLLVGYNDILLIPSGATNIEIKEVAPSNNYLAIRNLTGHYYLNGNWRIDFPRTMWFAGCYWHYERKPQGFAAPDHLKCLGPTTEPIFLVLLQQDRNVGIKYQYYIPEAQNLSTPDSYSWTLTQYEPCSVSCGGGFQTRNVTCNGRLTLEEVETKLCDINSKPSDTQQCNQEACPPRWNEGDWSKCSEPCGNNGTQERQVYCERVDAHGKASKVADAVCASEISKKPTTIQECNAGLVCPEWYVGPWLPCDKLCGEGVQTRTIKCYRKEDDEITILPDDDCPDEKPETSKECLIRPCEGIDWITTAWSGCKACGQTKETRTAYCGTKQGKIYANSLCDGSKKPQTVRECNGPPCEFQWYTSQWSKCSSQCNDGVQTRNVVCGAFDGKEIHKANDESKCDVSAKPNNTRDCEPKEDECVGEWFAGPWSACSKTCGGGQKERTVVCFANGTSVKPTLCNQADILFSVTDCSTEKCTDDKTVPVLGTRFDDDDDVEESEEDDDEYDDDMEECDYSTDLTDDDGDVMKVMPTDSVDFDGTETSHATESTLRDDELMLSDATGFELAPKSTSMPISTDETGSGDDDGSGDDELTSRSLDATTDVEGSAESSLVTEEVVVSVETTLLGSSISSDADDTTKDGSTVALDELSTTTDSGFSSTESGSTASDLDSTTDSSSTVTIDGSSSSESGSTTTSDLSTDGSDKTTESSPSSTDSSAFTTESSDSTVGGSTDDSSTTEGGSTDSSSTTEGSSTDGSSTIEGSSTDGSSTTDGTSTTYDSSTSTDSDTETTEIEDDFIAIYEPTIIPKRLDVPLGLAPTETTKGSTDDLSEASGSSETSDSDTTTTPSGLSSTSGSSLSTDSASSTSDETTETGTTDSSTSDSTSESTSDATSESTSDATSESTSESTSDSTSDPSTESTEPSESSTTSDGSSTSDGTTPTPGSDATTLSTDEGTTLSTDDGTTLSTDDVTTLSTDDATDTTESATTQGSSTSDDDASSISTDAKSTDVDGSSTTDSSLTTSTDSGISTDTTIDLETETISADEITTVDGSSTTLDATTTEFSEGSSVSDKSTDDVTDGSTTIDGSTTDDGSTTETPLDSTSLISTDSDGTTASPGSTDLTTEGASDSTSQATSDLTSDVTSTTDSSTGSTDDVTTASPLSTESETTGSTVEGSGSTTDDDSTSTFISTDGSSISTEIDGSTQSTTEGSTQSTDIEGSTQSTTEDSSKSTDTEGSTESTIEGSTISTLSTEEDTTIDIWTTTDSSTDATLFDDLTTPNTLITAIDSETTSRRPKMCRKKKSKKPKKPACSKSEFGCCPDGKTKAKGPFDEGCNVPKTCNETTYGCCPDGLSPATGKNNEGCPPSICNQTLFGCCPDDYTIAESPDFEGCPIETTTTELPTEETDSTSEASGSTDLTDTTETSESTESSSSTVSEDEYTTESTTAPAMHCAQSTYGCCPDGTSEATGENFHGCDIIDKDNCTNSYYGCCDDGQTSALGANGEGCASCIHARFGCCPDNKHPAHGPHKEGCCLNSQFGCCPDNILEAQGPQLEGCGCEYSGYGCCPDKITPARGYDNDGCGCEYAPHGCCSDQLTAAKGPNFAGCPCHTSQFGCCSDGITIPQGPHGYGCHCTHSEFKCCGDGITAAQGPDAEGCTCANSEFGCCPDGTSDAKGSNFEGCENIPESPQASCALHSEKGECSNYTVKYYFDATYGGCSRFWYGGCGGNGNKFDTQDDCEAVCVKPESKAVCDLPAVKGACDGYFPMYYYDAHRKTCTQFIYGGCLGNNNRFQTREECLQLCSVDDSLPVCEQPVEEGPCNGTFERWYFDKDFEVCRPFNYGGCKGNKNNFATEHACLYNCKKPGVLRESCKLDKEEGECTDTEARWYFSESDNKCMPFYFTGCGGNKNNYEAIEDCEQSCPKKIDLDLCHFPAEIGDCQNYTTKWYFDTRESNCRQFYYGGCGGNKNNFDNEDVCLNRCLPQPTVPPTVPPPTEPFNIGHCALPDEVGPCHQYENRWAYSPEDGLCHQFVYGGCGGNQNNFATSNECESHCGDSQDPCYLPAIQGSCNETITRWYFDERVGSCLEFLYSGCGANRNNFFTEQRCEEKCGRPESPEIPETGLQQVPEPEHHEPGVVEEYRTTKVVPEVEDRFDSSGDDYCNAPLDYGDDNCENPRESVAYFYNATEQKCAAFMFIGCGGNGNRFDSLSQCERQCGVSKGRDVCSEPSDLGPCDDWRIQYYYNAESKSCNPFYYGGCGGNGNRFESNEECESVCIAREEPISNKGDGRQAPEIADHTERPSEVQPEIHEPEEEEPCQTEQDHCNQLNCPYGISKEYNEKSCEICSCDDPCQNHECPDDSRCSVDFVPDDQQTHDSPIFIAVCRQVRKPGECPVLSNSTRCERECYEDSDCRGDKKCCVAGCGYNCVPPVDERAPTTAAPETPSPYPVIPGGIASVLEEKTDHEVNVNVTEGGVATLRCFATGYPYPTIHWKRGEVVVDTSVGRYHITSTGDLQIVQLHKTDSGSYVCVADNGLGPPVTRVVELTVDRPTKVPAYIIGDRNSTQIVTLNQPATLRCLAGGVPNVYISWWKGKHLIPYTDTISQRFEITKDYSLVFKRVELSDLGTYLCEAYSGLGKPVSIQVTLKAIGPVHIKNPEDEIYRQYLVAVPEAPKPSYPYRPAPSATPPRLPPREDRARMPKILATANIRFPNGTQFEPNRPIVLECAVSGSPKAVVRWYKDEEELDPSKRIRIIEIDEAGSSRLTISNSTKDDTGYYKCEAVNSHSKAYHTEYVVVEGIYIPASCTDNQFFANCGLIVEGNYCNHKYYSKFCCKSCTLAGQLSWSHPNNI